MLVLLSYFMYVFFFSSRRRHTRCSRDWSSDVCSSDLSHVPGHDGLPTLWDEVMYITLPGDRYLVTRGFGPGRVEDANGDGRGEIAIAGLSFRCDEPFRSWTKRFDGAARLVSGDDLRAGPIGDGL